MGIKRNILVLGFGDLGQALVKYHGLQYQFRGVKRSWIEAAPCPLYYHPIQSPQLDDHLAWADHIVFSPAPSGDEEQLYQEVYLKNMQFLIDRLKDTDCSIRSMILIGSTGIYPQAGDEPWTESSPIHPETLRQETLGMTEKNLVESGFPYVIFRCAGLYGENKGRFKERLSQGRITTAMLTQQYVHFIHLRDVCGAIHTVVKDNIVNEIYNVLDDSHIRRKAFYSFLGELFNLPIAEGGPPQEALAERCISNQKIKTQLGFSFHYPKITDYLRATVELGS